MDIVIKKIIFIVDICDLILGYFLLCDLFWLFKYFEKVYIWNCLDDDLGCLIIYDILFFYFYLNKIYRCVWICIKCGNK